MKSSFLSLLFLIFLPWMSQAQDFSKLKGSYLGQKPPGKVPEIFAPGFISTSKNELNSVFTPDGKEFFFSISTPSKGYTIWHTKMINGVWRSPEIAPFVSQNSDVDMCMSHDGSRLFWGSKRPIKPGGEPVSDFLIWYSEKTKNGWSKAKYLDSPVNSGFRSLYPTISKSGTMFFQSRRNDSFGKTDIYFSKFTNGVYQDPVQLGKAINSVHNEGDVLIAPDESWLIVCTGNREEWYGKGDLYISIKDKNGSWSVLKNMGTIINTEHTEYCPMLSPDGKFLFFTSGSTGNGDIYWVDAKIIEELKPDELK